MLPFVRAARITLFAAPEALQGAVAVGINGAGSVILGAAGNVGIMLSRGLEEMEEKEETEAGAAKRVVTKFRAAKKSMLGFSHPLYRPDDRRASRLLQLAKERGVIGRHLPIDRNGTIASIMLDLDFPSQALRGVPISARTIGLLGHLYEETQRPMGFRSSHHAEAATEYDGNKVS